MAEIPNPRRLVLDGLFVVRGLVVNVLSRFKAYVRRRWNEYD